MNCVIQAAYHGVSVAGGTIYCTYLPCLTCAKILLNVGIKRIVFEGHYPDPLSLELLTNANVELVRSAEAEAPT
jgi:dCMP deaminase